MSPAGRSGWLSRHAEFQRRRRDSGRQLARLSPREHEVLQLLVAGHRAAQIAEHFTVSLTTVRTQIRSILSKLDCNSQIEAVALAHRWMDAREHYT
jgi:DNA-binding CsgD family transcriptional regulator